MHRAKSWEAAVSRRLELLQQAFSATLPVSVFHEETVVCFLPTVTRLVTPDYYQPGFQAIAYQALRVPPGVCGADATICAPPMLIA